VFVADIIFVMTVVSGRMMMSRENELEGMCGV